MYVLRRFPLTTSAIALFSAYTVASVAVRKIKAYFATKNSSHQYQEPLVLPDIQYEILKYIIEDSDNFTNEILDLGLVCKDWLKYTSYHGTWFEMLEKLVIDSRRLENLTENEKNNSTADSIERLLGTKDVFSPKIMYYIYKTRINHYYHGQNPRPILIKLTAEMKLNKNNRKLWMPWLNHNILKAPEIVWKWLYTSIRHSKWIYPLLFDAFDPKKIYSTYVDTHHLRNLDKVLLTCSIGLSILPWLDSVIWNSMDVIKQVGLGEYRGLWMKNPWTGTDQIQTIGFLWWMQLFDDSFLGSNLIVIRGILSVLTMLFMRGLFPFLVSAAWIGAALGIFMFLTRKQNALSKIGKICAWICGLLVLAPLIYFYPGLLVLGSAAFFAIVIDVKSSTAFSEQKIKWSKMFLALSIGTMVWAVSAT